MHAERRGDVPAELSQGHHVGGVWGHWRGAGGSTKGATGGSSSNHHFCLTRLLHQKRQGCSLQLVHPKPYIEKKSRNSEKKLKRPCEIFQ